MDKIGVEMWSKIHGSQREKSFAMNYKLAAVMQQMGCGNTDIAPLAGFMDILVSWMLVSRHGKGLEAVNRRVIWML